MNYGDGMYASQFIGALYAEAYFEKDVHKLIQAGLKCIPSQCLSAESGKTVQIEITGKPREQGGKRGPAPCYLTGLALED